MTRREKATRWTFAFLATLVIGCGKGEYEKLVQAKIAALRQPAGPAEAEWEIFTSTQFAYNVNLPGPPEVTDRSQGNVQTEQVSAVSNGVRYQLDYSVSPQPIDPQQAAEAVQTVYEQDGYQIQQKVDTSVNGMEAVAMEFVKTVDQSRAKVQVINRGSQTCAMAVLGAEFTDEEADKFLSSFSRR